MKKNNFADSFHEQIIAISKAGAYDAIKDNYQELQVENEKLKARVKYLEDLIIEYSTKMTVNLSGGKVDQFLKDQINNPDDLKDVL